MDKGAERNLLLVNDGVILKKGVDCLEIVSNVTQCNEVVEKSSGFSTERTHESKGTIDNSLSFGYDDFVLCGEYPTVSTAMSMATIGNEIYCVVCESLIHCCMIIFINYPGKGIANK